MPAVAITGGIASGKSTFTALFHAALPGAEGFDADACSRRLLAADPAVAAEVRTLFGPAVFDADGRIDRAALRAVVFAEGGDPAPRRALEGILHPRVRAAWRGWLDVRLQNAPGSVMLVEIPLLYETGAEVFFGLRRKMGSDLLVEASVLAMGGGEVRGAGEQTLQGSHAMSCAFTSKKRLIMAAVCSQSRFSALSAAWPARVRR